MHGCTDSSGMRYKKIKNLNYTYWVSLNRVLNIKIYEKKKKIVFPECRALLDIIISVQKWIKIT